MDALDTVTDAENIDVDLFLDSPMSERAEEARGRRHRPRAGGERQGR